MKKTWQLEQSKYTSALKRRKVEIFSFDSYRLLPSHTLREGDEMQNQSFSNIWLSSKIKEESKVFLFESSEYDYKDMTGKLFDERNEKVLSILYC